MKPTISILLILLLSSCYYDNEETLYPLESNCGNANISYTADIKAIIDANCATSGCHVNNTGRTLLTQYSEVKAIADNGQLADRVLVRKDMPPSGPLSTCDQQKIRAWIDNGTPN